jgi:thiol-disulfide isomerase/thioredoxin
MKVFHYYFLFFIVINVHSVWCQKPEVYDLKRNKANNPILTTEAAKNVKHNYVFTEVESGDSIKISELKGKIVIVDFWQTWCGPCLKNFKTFQKAIDKWPDKIVILAASPDWADKPRKIKQFIRKSGYDFKFVFAGELEKKLKLGAIPYKIIYDADGKFISTVSDVKSEEEEMAFLEKLINK